MASSLQASMTLSDMMECAVCLDQVKDHCVLPCQHLFCRTCLEPLVKHGQVGCPVCRKLCHLDQKGVAGLPKNPLVVSILENMCELCREKAREVECGHCDKKLCASCYGLCQVKVNEKHTELKKRSKELIENGRKALAGVPDNMATLHDEIMAATTEIDQCFEAIINSMRKQQQFLKNELQTKAQKEMARLAKVSKDASSRLVKMENAINAQNNKQSVADLRDTWKQIKDLENDNDETETQISSLRASKIEFARSEYNIPVLGGIKETQQLLNITNNTQHSSYTNMHPIDYRSKKAPQLIIGGQMSGPGELSEPTGVAVCPVTQNIVVCDYQKDKVNIYDKDGVFVASFGSRGQEKGKFKFRPQDNFSLAYGYVTVSPDGTIIVADTHNNRLQTFSGQGRLIRVIGSKSDKPGQFSCPRGVCTDNVGNIYVCDSGNRRIQVLAPEGTVLRVFATKDHKRTWQPMDVALLSNRDIVVSSNDGTVEVFKSDGKHIGTYGRDILSSIYMSLKSVAVDRDNNILVSDYSSNKIHVFSESGQHICSWGEDTLSEPKGVACLADGRVVVANYRSKDVYIY